ncbi:hypothetical protein F5X98DRAFT_388924 [Xylaria grammica]|nr:hypothetical protein F5X98DRAFT_388924 [Xylaria grammica]
MSGKRYYTVLFVELKPRGSGVMYHVVGSITDGMRFQSREFHWPEHSEYYNSMLMGCTPKTGHPSAWEALLQAVPPPHKQKAFNVRIMKTEPVKSWDPLTFYSPGEFRREWTEQRAIPSLQRAGLLVPASGGASNNVAAAVAQHYSQRSSSSSTMQQYLQPSSSSAPSSSSSSGGSEWVWDSTHGQYRRWSSSAREWVWR